MSPRQLNAKLVTLQAPTDQKEILLRDGITIGRAPDNDLVLSVEQISRYHAKIVRVQMQYHLVDLHSRNGTYIGDVRLAPEQPHALVHAEQVQFAGTLAVFRFDDPDATAPLTTDQAKAAMSGLYVDSERREIWVEGRRLEPALSPQQFAFVELLSQDPCKVFGRDAVVAAVWRDVKGEGVSEAMIDALVARVRSRLREVNPDHDYVVTVRGHGFKYEPRG